MKNADLIPAWGRILQGQKPFLSIEITKECPLSCPGCYAYGPEHLGGGGLLRELRDAKGDDLVAGVLGLVRRYRPLHVSIVGGEPLVRYRELEVLLPKLTAMGVEVMVVTSAVRPIPESWRDLSNLSIAVSIDGLQPEHDRRRAPATYERVLKHIAGHRYNVHCTITRQLIQRRGLLRGVRPASGRSANGCEENLVQPLHSPGGRNQRGAADPARSRQGAGGTGPAAAGISPHRLVGPGAERLSGSPQLPAGMHLRPNHHLRFLRLRDGHHSLPVRRPAGVLRVRLFCVGRPSLVRQV